jgi:hypothetical protein
MGTREGKKKVHFRIEDLEERITPSNANFPPGQFPSSNLACVRIEQLPSCNLALAPGQSNPNEILATNPSNDK